MKITTTVSIIIPTGRPGTAHRTIKSAAAQVTNVPYEILISGKGVDRLSHLDIPNLQIIASKSELNPAQARNLAASQARGAYLLFIDDDCEPPPNWLETNLFSLEQSTKIGVVSGIIRGASGKYFAVCTDYTNFWAQQAGQKESRAWLYSASFGVRRACFEQVGGFDEELRVGEDVVFTRKAIEYGYECVFDPAIVVLHHHRKDSMAKFVTYMYENGRQAATYLSKYHLASLEQFGAQKLLEDSVRMTIKTTLGHRRTRPSIFFYGPGILVGYLSYHLGLLRAKEG